MPTLPEIADKYQLFAITLLLCTPTDLHNAMKLGDWPTIKNALLDLEFSEVAIESARVNIFNPLTQRPVLAKAFGTIQTELKNGLQFYDPQAGAHPGGNEAKVIVAALRVKDGD